MQKNTPVIVGVHQLTQRWQEGQMPQHPLALIETAAHEALADAGNSLKAVLDGLYVVNIFSYGYVDAPGALAQALSISPHTRLYTTEGGNTPQYLVNQACLALEKGEVRAVLIGGAEAVYGFKQAGKKGLRLDWPPRAQPQQVKGEIRVPVNDVESLYELYAPVNMYPIFETALRAQKGHSPAQHQQYLGALYQKFARVAAQHPQAWIQEAYTAEEIYQPSEENRYVGFPYSLRMNANINVDQATAIVLTTVGEAEKQGIPPEKWVFPMGGAHLNEVWEVSRRPRLYESVAIGKAAAWALQQAGLSLADIGGFDLYSCFPSAVQMGRNALGLAEDDPRPLTLTGGLSFFGGAGNNYVSHSIITAVEQIRKNPRQALLITALGWYATKHAVGVYGSQPPRQSWQESQHFERLQAEIDASALPPPQKEAQGKFFTEGYVILYNRMNQPEKGVAIGRLENGHRTIAYIEGDTDTLRHYCETELVGQTGFVRFDAQRKRNLLRFEG